MSTERRSISQPAAIAKDAEGREFIEGYALVFYRDGDTSTEYELWNDADGRAVERITPEFAHSALEKGNDIIGVFNHDPANLLGRRANGTLALTIDDRGLKYRIPYDPTDPDHTRLAPKMKRGDLKGSSFMFTAEDRWEGPTSDEVRWLKGGDDSSIFDVGPVTNPAYGGTTAGMRSDAGFDITQMRDARRKAAADKLRSEMAERSKQLAELGL